MEDTHQRRPKDRRFPYVFQFCSTQAHADAIDWLADNSAQTRASIHRLALDQFLRQAGALPVPHSRDGNQAIGAES